MTPSVRDPGSPTGSTTPRLTRARREPRQHGPGHSRARWLELGWAKLARLLLPRLPTMPRKRLIGVCLMRMTLMWRIWRIGVAHWLACYGSSHLGTHSTYKRDSPGCSGLPNVDAPPNHTRDYKGLLGTPGTLNFQTKL